MVRAALLSGAMLVAAPAFAGSGSIDKVDPSKGEVLLELHATGSSSQKAIRFSTSCQLSAYAKSADEAKKELEDEKAQLRKALPGAELDLSAPAVKVEGWGAATDAAYAATQAAEAAADAVEIEAGYRPEIANNEESKVGYQLGVGISVGTLVQYYQAQTAMQEAGCNEQLGLSKAPKMDIADEKGADDAALRDALNQAKAQAESYASATNLKILRAIRISEVSPLSELFGAEYTTMMAEMRNGFGRAQPLSDIVTVSKSVYVDYVLGPK